MQDEGFWWQPAPLAALLKSRAFEFTITTVIVLNALLIGLETDPRVEVRYGGIINTLNAIVLAIFVVELVSRMYAYGRDFWRDGWSWFDLIVVAISFVPATDGLSALRAFRAVRLLRLITIVPSLRRVVEGLIRALPGLGSIVLLLVLLLYVFAVIGTKLYGAGHPDYFGTLGASAFTLFTVMTLEGWPDVARDVMAKNPWSWVFFVVYIMLSSWAVLNLFIGVIVDAMQKPAQMSTERLEEMVDREQDEIMMELRRLRKDVADLKAMQSAQRPKG